MLDGAAIGDIDYSAAGVLARAVQQLHGQHIQLCVCNLTDPVLSQLDRYGIAKALGPEAFYDTPGAALEAFHAAPSERS